MSFEGAVKTTSRLLQYPTTLPAIMKVTLSVAIIVSASTVLVAINRNQRDTQTHHLFFIANVMFANIMAVTMRCVVAYAAVLKIMNPNINIVRCKALCMGTFPVVASFLMVVALCLDRMFTVMAPDSYKKIMVKGLACAIVAVVWIMSCVATYIGLSDCDLADIQDGTCSTGCFEQFETKAIVLPMVVSGVLAGIHNMFIFHKVFISTTLDGRLTKCHKIAKLYKAWRVYKETQPISVTLLLLGGYNIAASVILIFTGFTQSHAEGFFQDAIISFSSYNIINVSMLIYSLLYVKLLYVIRERMRRR